MKVCLIKVFTREPTTLITYQQEFEIVY